MIIHLTPGDPARVMLGVDAAGGTGEQLREQMGPKPAASGSVCRLG